MTAATVLPFRAMPEPPRFGLAGHLPDWLGVENARDTLARLQRYAAQCGPVARVSLGPVRMVVISDPDIAAEVLADPRANYKGALYGLTRVVLDNVLLLNGEAWERHRKIYRQALRGVDAVGAATFVVRRFLGELVMQEAPLRLDQAVFRLVGDIVGQFVAGVRMPDELEPDRRRIQHELAAVGIDLQTQPWTYLSPMRWIRLRRSVAAVRRFFREAVQRRLRGGEDVPDVLGGFLALARSGEYSGDEDALQEGVVNFFFTAHDVLASSAAWILYLIAQHPEIQTDLRLALRAGDGELLRRIIKEGLRLYPGYSLFGRTTQAAMTIGNYAVPRGTMLLASPYVTHRLDRHWDEPTRFDPDRWRGRGTGAPSPGVKEGYMPFGTGARGCLASHLAFPVLEAVVAEIINKVELRAVAGHDPGLAYWGTAYPRHGMPVHVRPAEV